MPVLARTALTPGPKPTAIVPGREAVFFAHPPTIRVAFARDEPFIEGELAYGYPGRVVTAIQRGGDIVAPAGSPAFGIPVQVHDAPRLPRYDAVGTRDPGKLDGYGRPELAWCAAVRKPSSPKVSTVCLFNEGLAFGDRDNLVPSAGYILDQDAYGGGEIGTGGFDLGAPVRVRYYLQNLGKIARVKGQILVGDVVTTEWGYMFGDIGRGSQPAERLFAVGGGVISITPDSATKGRYTLRIVAPLNPEGRAQLTEVRNDSRVKDRGSAGAAVAGVQASAARPSRPQG